MGASDLETRAHREALDDAVGALIDNYVENVCHDHPDTGHGYIHLHAKQDKKAQLREAAKAVYDWGAAGNAPGATIVRVSAMLDDIEANKGNKKPGDLVIAFVVTPDEAHSIEAHQKIGGLADALAQNLDYFEKNHYEHYCCWSDHP